MDEQTERTAVEQLRHDAHAETNATAGAAVRRWVPYTVIASLLVSMLTAVTVLAASTSVLHRVDANDAAVAEVRKLAEDAKTAGDVANEALLQRGQPPVPIPEPGEAEDSDVLVAAATARVLAMLPDTTPTADDLYAAVGTYMAANASRFGPTPQQITEGLTAYLAEHPIPAGPPGVDGEPGRGISGTATVSGRLIVTYDDGTTEDAGPLPPGPPGRGVQRAEVVDCRWRVTYTDGVSEDAGSACTTETVTAPAPTTTTTQPGPPPLLPPRR